MSKPELNKIALVRDFLIMYAKTEAISAQRASQRMRYIWGISLDWHEFARVIDDMVRAGSMEKIGFDFYGRYRMVEQGMEVR